MYVNLALYALLQSLLPDKGKNYAWGGREKLLSPGRSNVGILLSSRGVLLLSPFLLLGHAKRICRARVSGWRVEWNFPACQVEKGLSVE